MGSKVPSHYIYYDNKIVKKLYTQPEIKFHPRQKIKKIFIISKPSPSQPVPRELALGYLSYIFPKLKKKLINSIGFTKVQLYPYIYFSNPKLN